MTNSPLNMVNAWSLAASVLDGTLDEDYPIMKKDKIKIDTSKEIWTLQ